MKKYGILLSAAEHKALRQLAADQGVTMQDIARGALLQTLKNPSDNSQLPTAVPSAKNSGSVVARLDRLAADLAELKAEVLRGSSPEPESDLHRSTEILSSARICAGKAEENLSGSGSKPSSTRKTAG